MNKCVKCGLENVKPNMDGICVCLGCYSKLYSAKH